MKAIICAIVLMASFSVASDLICPPGGMRCGPLYGDAYCTDNLYCNQGNGWCGDTDEHAAASNGLYDRAAYDECLAQSIDSITVLVGQSTDSQVKTVDVGDIGGILYCPPTVNRDNWPVTGQFAEVNDEFSVVTSGSEVTVTRTNGPSWGMDLYFECDVLLTPEPTPSPTDSPTETPDYEMLDENTLRCPAGLEILTSAECQIAYDQVTPVYGFVATRPMQQVFVPGVPYQCSVQYDNPAYDQAAHFNYDDASDSSRVPEFRVLCLREYRHECLLPYGEHLVVQTNMVINCPNVNVDSCLNDNLPYADLQDAFTACENVEGCEYVMHYSDDQYYLRRGSDPSSVATGISVYTHACMIDGGYTDWGPCSATCGLGTQQRFCTNPEPQNGGYPCDYPTGTNLSYEMCDTGIECPTTCERRAGWCVHEGSTYSLVDCNGDGVEDHLCTDRDGNVGYADGVTCIEDWPNAVCDNPNLSQVRVEVGPSTTQSVTYSLYQFGGADTYTCPALVDRDNWLVEGEFAQASDYFTTEVEGTTVTVTRVDGASWDLNLVFECQRENTCVDENAAFCQSSIDIVGAPEWCSYDELLEDCKASCFEHFQDFHIGAVPTIEGCGVSNTPCTSYGSLHDDACGEGEYCNGQGLCAPTEACCGDADPSGFCLSHANCDPATEYCSEFHFCMEIDECCIYGDSVDGVCPNSPDGCVPTASPTLDPDTACTTPGANGYCVCTSPNLIIGTEVVPPGLAKIVVVDTSDTLAPTPEPTLAPTEAVFICENAMDYASVCPCLSNECERCKDYMSSPDVFNCNAERAYESTNFRQICVPTCDGCYTDVCPPPPTTTTRTPDPNGRVTLRRRLQFNAGGGGTGTGVGAAVPADDDQTTAEPAEDATTEEPLPAFIVYYAACDTDAATRCMAWDNFEQQWACFDYQEKVVYPVDLYEIDNYDSNSEFVSEHHTAMCTDLEFDCAGPSLAPGTQVYDSCLEYPTEEEQIECLKNEVLALEGQLETVSVQYEQVLLEEAAAEQTCQQAKEDIETALGSCSSSG